MKASPAPPGEPPAPKPERFARGIGLAGEARAVQAGWTVWIALHLLLGVVCRGFSAMGTVHALGVLALGFYLAILGRPLFQLACWGIYVAGSEVLWRMLGSALPWEFGKYAISLVFLMRLLRYGWTKVSWVPILYFALLVPALFPTLLATYSEHGLNDTRKLLSFNLSGPFSILVCSLLFSRVQLSDFRTRRLMAWFIFPAISIAIVILLGIRSLEHLDFDSGSNLLASGGFGPNQVSGVLGAAAFYALLLVLAGDLTLPMRALFVALAVWFAAHAALSFSRTGIYLFGIGFTAALPFLAIRKLLRLRAILALAVTVAAGLLTWVFLMRFTEGQIGERFSSASLTRRDLIAMQDIELWKQNPIFGAGIGMSSVARSEGTAGRVGAHTEYTRLLAEHGALGIMAGLVFLGMAARPLLAKQGFTKGVLLGGVAMTLASLAASAMRTAAPGFFIGMASARLLTYARRPRRRRSLAPPPQPRPELP